MRERVLSIEMIEAPPKEQPPRNLSGKRTAQRTNSGKQILRPYLGLSPKV